MFKHYQQLWEILSRKNRQLILFLFLVNLINAFLEIVSVGAIFPIIFSIVSPESINSIPMIKNFLENYAPVRGKYFILAALGFILIVFIVKNFFFGWILWFRSFYTEKIAADITQKLFSKYMLSSYEYHIQRNTGGIIRNLTHSIESFKSNFLKNTLELFTHISIGISYLAFLSYIDPILIIYFMIIMGFVMFFLTIKVRAITKNLGYQNLHLTKEKNHYVLLGMMGLKEIKVLIKEMFFIKKNDHLVQALRENLSKITFFTNLPRLVIETTVIFLAITTIMILFAQDQTPQHIIAKLGIFGFASLKIFPMFSFISSSLSRLAFGGTSLEILYHDLKGNIHQKNNIPTSNIDALETDWNPKYYPFNKSIELKNIYFHYSDNKHDKKNVLNGINLTIKKNSIIGLVGESGSGKTTLVDIIIGFIRPQHGKIIIDGKTIKNEGVWSNKFGYIPQQIYLSNTSIKENVAFGCSKESVDEKRIWEVLKVAQLGETVKNFPNGIETEVGEGGVKLSGGQRQRVGIARALYHEPEILILDEATSALDNRTELEFINQFKSLKIKTTQVIIAHRLTTVKHCHKIYILDKGRIVEQGTYAQLEKSGKYFRRMLLKDLKKTTKKKPKSQSRRT